MKRTLFSLLNLLLTAGVIFGQNSGNGSISGVKQSYIANQGYLSKNGVSLYGASGDSLKGFDEKGLTNKFLGQGVAGWEVSAHIEHLKREFIKQKYNLARPAPSPYMATPTVALSTGKKKGGGAALNVAPCVNEGFEATAAGQYTGATAVTGWTIESRSANGTCPPYSNWTGGSPVFWIKQTPLTNWPFSGSPMGIIPHSPLGGTVVAQMNDEFNSDYECTRIRQTFPVTASNALFQFAYAGYWQLATGHNCCERPGFEVRMYDCTGAPLSCVSLSLFPGTGCASAGVAYTTTSNGDNWTSWQVKSIDFTPYIGTCITVEFLNTDCSLGGHWGSMLLDVMCGGQNIGTNLPPASGGTIPGPVSFCAGSNVAVITAPVGYATYQWISPITGTVAPPQGTMSTLSVTNPVPGSVYTVNLMTASGCQYVSTNTIVFSQVNIAGIGSSPTCPNGTSGSATVAGNGSGAGYTYTWTNTSNSVVGTQSVVTGLAPGVYSITIGGLGATGCGTAAATTTIITQPPSTVSIFKPYCGSEAYLNSPNPGTGHKWYYNGSLLTGTNATGPNFTVTSTMAGFCNGCNWWVSYTTNQGCKDSVRFTLVSTPPGMMTVPPLSIKVICPAANNGTAAVNITPASGAPVGYNTFSVSSTGTTAPYTTSLGPTSSNVFTIGGLSPGTYTVSGFDGSCKYGTSFNVVPLVYSWNVTPGPPGPTPILCPGASTPAAVNFPGAVSPTQYSYSWTPTNWLVGNNGSLKNTIVTPAGIPAGSVVTTIYTIVVTPSVAFCPTSKTLAITGVNPPTPTITAIPALCDISAIYSIQALPSGGSFKNAAATPTLINQLTGAITPTGAPFGVHQFTYDIVFNTCPASQTGSFQISQYFTPALTSSVSPLCVTSPAVNLMTIVQQTNGVWKNGAGATIPGGIFNPAGLSTGNYQLTYTTQSSPDPQACPDFTTMNISVTNTSVPNIVPKQAFCTNASAFTMTVSPTGGTWSGSNITSNGLVTPSLISQPGMHSVTYTVTDGPCINSATSSFHVSQFNTAALKTQTLAEVCYDDKPLNLMSIVASTVNGIWSGHTNVSAAGMLDPSGGGSNPMPTGIYEFTYATTPTPSNGALCPDFSTIKISVLNPPQPAVIPAGPLCSRGGTVQLMVTPSDQGGSWTASAYLTKGGVFTPSLAGVGNNAVQYVIGKPGCSRQNTKFISIEAFISASLTTQDLPDLCNTGAAINLMPYTMNNTGSWQGAGIQGTSFNPSIAGRGEHVLTYTTATLPSGLCPDQSTIAVTVFSLATPNIAKIGPVCSNTEPLQLTADVQGGLYGGVNNRAVDLKGLFIPASAQLGDNVVNYTITSGPCVAYAQTTISVEKFVSADFHTTPPTFCSNGEQVNMNHFVVNPGGTWSGDGILTGSSMFDPGKANPGENNVITYYTHSMPTASLCPDKETVRVKVVALPDLSAVAHQGGSHCAPHEVVFNMPGNNNPSAKVFWTTGDGSQQLEGHTASHVYTKAGTYSVVLNYHLDGCKGQYHVPDPIRVYQTPQADFSMPEEVLISSPEVQLHNLSTPLGENTYTWMIEGAVVKPGEINPIIGLPAQLGKYNVTLMAQNIEGCKDQVTKMIEVKNDFNVYIPTSFSPNFDNLNDVFKPEFSPYGLDLRTYEMEIFDRWGHLIFRTNDARQGWNGSVQNKGEPMKEGTYIYKIRYKDLDGNAYSKVGHIVLLK